jgi:glycosyltransferase involved in cell wall biosynthesis
MAIVCNTRIMAFPMSGVQRVTGEILSRLGGAIAQVAPPHPLSGWRGHVWEQTVLPQRAKGRLLWSPSATGPLTVRRQVITMHDVAFLDHPEFFSKNYTRLYVNLLQPLSKRVGHIITVSEFSKERIIKRLGVPSDKVSVVPNGVAEAFHPRSPESCARVTQELGLPTDRYFLAQATSDRRKNLARIIEAWVAVAPMVADDVWLIIVGNMGRTHIFGRPDTAAYGPRVLQLGFVSEESLCALTAGAIAFLYPSLYEGFGLPVLEAMAVGTPVITSTVTALPEIAGDAAILVSPLSSQEIAAAMLEVLGSSELREKLRYGGLQRARQFSWDRAAHETLRILQSCLPQQSVP